MSWIFITSILLLLVAPFMLADNGALAYKNNKASIGYLLCLLALIGLCLDKGGLLGTLLFLSILSVSGMIRAFINIEQQT